MPGSGSRSRKSAFLLAALFIFVLAIALVLGLRAALSPRVEESWRLYVERVFPERRLLVLSSAQRYAASKEFTAKILALVDVRASVEIEAWADVFYVVDASDPKAWEISWDRKTKVLSILAPEPTCLPPAVRTETIEVRSKGANIVTNTLFRLKAEAVKMQAELSRDLADKARETLSDPDIRRAALQGLEGIGRTFSEAVLGKGVYTVSARFRGDQNSLTQPRP
ncbi:MAG TPA: hypothetical protein VIO60_10765 [Rectinemataceae bacterium]